MKVTCAFVAALLLATAGCNWAATLTDLRSEITTTTGNLIDVTVNQYEDQWYYHYTFTGGTTIEQYDISHATIYLGLCSHPDEFITFHDSNLQYVWESTLGLVKFDDINVGNDVDYGEFWLVSPNGPISGQIDIKAGQLLYQQEEGILVPACYSNVPEPSTAIIVLGLVGCLFTRTRK